jgi:hypothetical protein
MVIRLQWAMRRMLGWKPLSDGDQRLVELGYEVHNMNELLKTLLQSNGRALDGVGEVAERVAALEHRVKDLEGS